MALLPDPTTAVSERSSVKNRLTGSRRRGSGIKNRHRSRTVRKTSLRGARRMRAQGVQGQGCPQHESTQPGPLTLLPHKTRVRHKNKHRSRTVSKTSLRGARRMRAQGVQGQGCPQHESTQPGPLTLLPHKTRVRHKNKHRSRTVSKTSLRGARRMRAQGVQGQGCPQHERTQPGPLTLLPHKTRVRHKNRHRSKQSAKRV